LGGGSYWPPGASNEVSLTAFIEAFAAIGYQPCASGELESGIEKVALYALSGRPTHAARQDPTTGEWLSKLGRAYDIMHVSLNDLSGGHLYGEVAIYLERKVDPT
jgi:hypothetical protein